MIKNKLLFVLTFNIVSIFCSDKEVSDISVESSVLSEDSKIKSGGLKRVPRIPSSESNSSLQEEVEEYFKRVVLPAIKLVESSSELDQLN